MTVRCSFLLLSLYSFFAGCNAARVKITQHHTQGANQNDLKRQGKCNLAEGEFLMDFSSTNDDFRQLHAHRISCPVLSSFYRRGWLNPDMYGRVNKWELYSALQKSGTSLEFSVFQSYGVAAYKEDDLEQLTRDRTLGFVGHLTHVLKQSVWSSEEGSESKRFLNIFRMNPGDCTTSHQVQHGFSTTITDARFDNISKPLRACEGEGLVMDGELGTEAELERVRKLRKARFDEWFGQPGVVEKGRVNAAGLVRLLSTMKAHGDKSSEWSLGKDHIQKFHPEIGGENASALSEWQGVSAWMGFLTGFATLPSGDWKEAYFTLEELESFFLRSLFPTDWVKRQWGFTDFDFEVFVGFGKIATDPALKLPAKLEEEIQKTHQKWGYRALHAARPRVQNALTFSGVLTSCGFV